MDLAHLHRWVGITTVATFLVTGIALLALNVAALPADSGLRGLFRSRHVYLLLAGLVNLLAGIGYLRPAPGWRRGLGLAGSVLMLVAPLLLAGAFFMEPMHTRQFGALSGVGIQLLFWGSVSYAIAAWREAAVPREP